MRKRNVPSPNRADAVLGSMAVQDYAQMTEIVQGPWKSVMDFEYDSRDRAVLSNIGASAGW
jgi:hypothetical protein